MAKRYYTLAIKDIESGQFYNEFGAYCLEDVEYEKEALCLDHKAKNMKIITTAPDQKAIDAAFVKLNGGAV
jgi:hypothetical protein